MFTPDPRARQMPGPASGTPLRDYLNNVSQGVNPGYVVLPRSLAEAMPLPWQQHMVHLLAEFHHAYGHLQWPLYRVVPSRREKLVDLDEEQLALEGFTVELDTDGELIYRGRDGKRIENPEETMVLVSCLDPIPKQAPQPPRPAVMPPPPAQQGPMPQQSYQQPPPPQQHPTQSGPHRVPGPPQGYPGQPPNNQHPQGWR